MESFIFEMALKWAAPYLTVVVVWVGVGLTLAGVLHSVTTLVLRPIAKWTPSKTDDRYVNLLVWWLDAIADVLREWALAKWYVGFLRAKRMWNDRKRPIEDRRWE